MQQPFFPTLFWTFTTVSQRKILKLLNQILLFPFPFNYSLNKKRKIKRAFIKTRKPHYLICFEHTNTKKNEKQIKNNQTTGLQDRIQNLKLNNDTKKSWRTLKNEMGFLDKESTYLDLKNITLTAKTDTDKLKLFEEQMKSVLATKTELKNKNLAREIVIFLYP